VERAEDWRWSTLNPDCTAANRRILSEWPLVRPANWTELVNKPQTEAELAALRHCVNRGTPYGDKVWVSFTAKQLGLQATLQKRGRPKKSNPAA
jgi:putative transposase